MRILLVKTSSLGDVVHNLPVATDLARHFPDAEIDWVVEENFAELPRLHPAVHKILPVAIRRWRKALHKPATWREIGAFRRAVKADCYDAVIDSQGLLKSALIASMASGERIGHDCHSAREPLASRFYNRRIFVSRDTHAVERNRLLAATAFGYALDPVVDYGISAPPLAASWLPKGNYAVLLTATSRADKEWPEGDWQALGMALIATGLRCVLPGGSPAERQRAARLSTTLGRAVAAPAMNLADLAGLLSGAALVVGVDTGLVHLAAALGRPTLALYCGSDPELTGVLAGANAVNLGSAGSPPSASEVVRHALQMAS
ncbi:MAG: lipopolysaccharide heptosyltransferase I [Gammaproteobacteria bacterium]|nr:lipopolysaccharide heptosyltransferase I [Gammaproteobacteria bacterium]MBU1416200.1 lipopolysaccharide heptosyltransferase I [Gammaproteobacteria bacterium]